MVQFKRFETTVKMVKRFDGLALSFDFILFFNIVWNNLSVFKPSSHILGKIFTVLEILNLRF